LAQGKEKTIEVLSDRPEVLERIRQTVIDKLQKGDDADQSPDVVDGDTIVGDDALPA
jgi:hypothetical protein